MISQEINVTQNFNEYIIQTVFGLRFVLLCTSNAMILKDELFS